MLSSENVITKNYDEKSKENKKYLLEEAIAEIESLSSSSEAENVPPILENLKEPDEDFRNLLIIEDSQKFLQYEKCTDEESSGDEEQYKLDKELEYFEIFEDVPQFDDISTDLTDELIVNRSVNMENETNYSDMGKFVNPLTGVASVSKEDENDYNIEDHESKQDERDQSQSQDYKSDISNEEIIDEDIEQSVDSFENLLQPIKHDDDIFQQFAEIQKDDDQLVLESDLKVNLIIREQQYLIQQNTLEFLKNLIDRCVAKAEYIDDNIILRRNLDKMKLLKDLKDKWDLWEREKRAVQFLNRKCVEYFRRKSIFRLIAPDDPKTIKTDNKRYRNALEDLDKLLIREEKTKNLYVSQVFNLEDQFKNYKQQFCEEINNFELLIRQTFHHDQFTKLQNSLSNGISKMAAIRKEISNVRFKLLLKQHEVSSLRKLMKNVNDLGNTLQVTQYESLEAEANTLIKNIEERNVTLNKLHDHYNFDVHNMAHLKEKQNMLQNTVMVQKQYFNELRNEEKNMRQVIKQLRQKRKNLRLELRNLSFQSGLLDKPILMKDYDETVEMVFNMRKIIEGLKETIEKLTEKISKMEKLNLK